jgi:hypothetical protein
MVFMHACVLVHLLQPDLGTEWKSKDLSVHAIWTQTTVSRPKPSCLKPVDGFAFFYLYISLHPYKVACKIARKLTHQGPIQSNLLLYHPISWFPIKTIGFPIKIIFRFPINHPISDKIMNVGPWDQHAVRRPSEATYPTLIIFADMER